jgi:hypothetical protein
VNGPLRGLVDGWCERRDLAPLALPLPAWLGNSGLTDGWAAVMEALRDLRARGGLPPDEQAVVERVLTRVESIVYRA